MTTQEIIAELRGAAYSLNTAGVSMQTGDIRAAEVDIEDALFRTQSLLERIRNLIAASPMDGHPTRS